MKMFFENNRFTQIKSTIFNFNYFQPKTPFDLFKITWLPNHFIINLPKESLSTINIYFLRTQKRYNKMRYARTRRYSRVAFYVSLLALILVGQRLEWLFGMTTTYTFKIKWLINYILILTPVFTCVKINIYGISSLLRFFKLFYKWFYLQVISSFNTMLYVIVQNFKIIFKTVI